MAVRVVSFDTEATGVVTFAEHAKLAKDGHGGVYVRKVRDIANRTRILCQDRGEQDRQGGILRTLHPDGAGKGNAAFDDDFVHEVFTSQRWQPGKPPGTYSTFR